MAKSKAGVIVWVTGLAGSGKSTLGRALQSSFAAEGVPFVLLDGDRLREVTGQVFGYSAEERRRCALFYSRLCQMLAEQGVNVICATISMFDEVRDENRAKIEKYVEIYLKASADVLQRRNQKNLYSGQNRNVAGLHVEIEEPKRPDCVFNIIGDDLALEQMVAQSRRVIHQIGGVGNSYEVSV